MDDNDYQLSNFRIIALCEIQTTSSRIWTRVTVSISYDRNHYTTNGNFCIYQPLRINDVI